MAAEKITSNINEIKTLIREYYELPDKAHIQDPDGLLKIFTIGDSVHGIHPHAGYGVYISKRALKHYVEARKKELVRRHSDEEALEIMFFAIDKIVETISDYDSYNYVTPRHEYAKDYSIDNVPIIRIIIDAIDDALQICSIHFKKKKRD